MLLPLGLVAVLLVYLAGPSLYLISLTLGVSVAALGVIALTERRTVALWVATLLGFITLAVPVVQFAVQS